MAQQELCDEDSLQAFRVLRKCKRKMKGQQEKRPDLLFNYNVNEYNFFVPTYQWTELSTANNNSNRQDNLRGSPVGGLHILGTELQ